MLNSSYLVVSKLADIYPLNFSSLTDVRHDNSPILNFVMFPLQSTQLLHQDQTLGYCGFTSKPRSGYPPSSQLGVSPVNKIV